MCYFCVFLKYMLRKKAWKDVHQNVQVACLVVIIRIVIFTYMAVGDEYGGVGRGWTRVQECLPNYSN